MSIAHILPLAFLGGAFDPVHHGHLRLALECQQALGARQVVLMPTGQAVHKPGAHASNAQRWQMLQLALAEQPDLAASDWELQRSAPSYTVHTLQHLRAQYGVQQPLIWIVGQDAYDQLPSWHEAQRLPELAHWVVLSRPGFAPRHPAPWLAERAVSRPETLAQSPAGCVLHLALPQLDISSTRIRQLCAAGASISYLLPPGVQAYIQQQQLYRS